MRPSPRLVLGALCTLAALILPGVAHAGPPGQWTQVTGFGVEAKNTDEIGLARTADGVLHVAWTRAPGGTYDDQLLHSAIGASGKGVTGPHGILGGLELNNSVDMLTGPDGRLRVFFAGLNPASPLDGRLATATASPDGMAWLTQPTPASSTAPGNTHPVYAASGIGGGLASSGLPIGVWGDSSPSGAAFNVGLDAGSPDVPLSPQCCELGPDVAAGADGQLVMAWVFLGDTTSLKARVLSSGQELVAPGSEAAQYPERVSLSGRSKGPGVYIAYTSGTNPFMGYPSIWRVGATKAIRLSGTRGARHTRLASAPDGRMWVLWERSGRTYARRSNTAVTKFGSTVVVKPPKNTQSVFAITGEGSRGPLDVLALIDRGSLAYWHQRVLPGLTLGVSTTKVSTAKGGKITFKVTDAGSAIAKANVSLKLSGKTLKGTTNSKGQVSLTVAKGTKRSRYRATATKSGYTKATRWIRVTK